jgi:hypothetical protein
MGYFKASKYSDVPRTTLKRYVKQRRLLYMEEATTKLARKPVFPPNLEADLAPRCLQMKERISQSQGLT